MFLVHSGGGAGRGGKGLMTATGLGFFLFVFLLEACSGLLSVKSGFSSSTSVNNGKVSFFFFLRRRRRVWNAGKPTHSSTGGGGGDGDLFRSSPHTSSAMASHMPLKLFSSTSLGFIFMLLQDGTRLQLLKNERRKGRGDEVKVMKWREEMSWGWWRWWFLQ